MQTRKWYNKHMFFTILISCLVVLIVTGAGFLNASDDGTLFIQDIEGDRSILDHVIIRGLIQDEAHGIAFDIRNHEVNKKFSYYNSSEDINYELMGAAPIGDSNYSYRLNNAISPDANIETTEKKEIAESGYIIEKTTKADAIDFFVNISKIEFLRNKTNWSEIRFDPGTQLKSDILEFELTSLDYYDDNDRLLSHNEGGDSIGVAGTLLTGGNPKDAYTLMDGRLYFTLLTSPYHRGSNGIYKVEDFVELWEWLSDESAKDRAQYGKVKPITTFSLDEQNMSVLAIEAVSGKLILIVIENDTLILRSYHPETGGLLDELPVGELDHEDYGGTLQSFVDDNILNLNIIKSINEGDEQYLMSNILLSVDVADKLSLLHHIEGLQLEGEEITPKYIDQIATADQKLFVFTNLSIEEEQRGINYEVLWPKHNVMFVYQGSEFLYKGELITDIDEDYITHRERIRSYGGGFGYEQYQFRQIYGYQVERR